MPPVQPRPTTTTSTSFSLVTMLLSPSAHVGNADGIGWKFLVPVFLYVLAMHRDGAGKADQFPPRLVAVAAVDRVGEHSFHHGLIERGPEYACGRTIVENELAGRKRNEHLFALQRVEEVEGLAVGFAAMSVGRLDAGAVKLRRRERQLIALARHAQFPRTLHVESLALAPAARKRAID